MSEFKEEGFLSTKLVDASQQCRKQYAEWFTLCESINKFSLAITSKVACHPDNRQECLAAALFLRAISIFEGIIILTERCMLDEVKILLRTLMDTVFALRAISLHAEVAEEYYHSQLIIKRGALRKIAKSNLKLRDSQGRDLTERIKELDSLIGNNAMLTDTKYLAQKAGLYDFYATAYTVLSWAVHSNILDIAGSHMAGQSGSHIDSIHLSIQMEEAEKWFMSTCECMVIAMQSVNDTFKAGVENEIADYERRYKNLFASHRDDYSRDVKLNL
jgi:hypothetical protein